MRREPIFHRAEFGRTRADLETTAVGGFWETGASGRRYSRKLVLDALEKRHSQPFHGVWKTPGFCRQELAPDLYLLISNLLQDSPPTCMEGLWLIAFSSRPAHCLRASAGSPGSRAWSSNACFGSSTPRGRASLAHIAMTRCCLPDCLMPSAPRNARFRSSIPSLQIPLSIASGAISRLSVTWLCPTLQVRPRDRPRTAQGQGGSPAFPVRLFRFSTPMPVYRCPGTSACATSSGEAVPPPYASAEFAAGFARCA